MNLHDAWNQLGHQPEEDMKAIQLPTRSHSLVSSLKKGLGIKLLWILFFIVVISGLIVMNLGSNVTYFLFLALAYMVAGAFLIYPKYQRIPAVPDLQGPSLPVLKSVRAYAREALRTETNLGKWFMPIFPIGGFLLAMPEDTLTWANISGHVWQTVAVVIGALILGYFSHLLGEKLNRIAFGEQLAQLDQVIADLEEEE